jgi:hypothetical protein
VRAPAELNRVPGPPPGANRQLLASLSARTHERDHRERHDDRGRVRHPIQDVAVAVESRDRLGHFDEGAEERQPLAKPHQRHAGVSRSAQRSENDEGQRMLELVAQAVYRQMWRLGQQRHRDSDAQRTPEEQGAGPPPS